MDLEVPKINLEPSDFIITGGKVELSKSWLESESLPTPPEPVSERVEFDDIEFEKDDEESKADELLWWQKTTTLNTNEFALPGTDEILDGEPSELHEGEDQLDLDIDHTSGFALPVTVTSDGETSELHEGKDQLDLETSNTNELALRETERILDGEIEDTDWLLSFDDNEVIGGVDPINGLETGKTEEKVDWLYEIKFVLQTAVTPGEMAPALMQLLQHAYPGQYGYEKLVIDPTGQGENKERQMTARQILTDLDIMRFSDKHDIFLFAPEIFERAMNEAKFRLMLGAIDDLTGRQPNGDGNRFLHLEPEIVDEFLRMTEDDAFETLINYGFGVRITDEEVLYLADRRYNLRVQ